MVPQVSIVVLGLAIELVPTPPFPLHCLPERGATVFQGAAPPTVAGFGVEIVNEVGYILDKQFPGQKGKLN